MDQEYFPVDFYEEIWMEKFGLIQHFLPHFLLQFQRNLRSLTHRSMNKNCHECLFTAYPHK